MEFCLFGTERDRVRETMKERYLLAYRILMVQTAALPAMTHLWPEKEILSWTLSRILSTFSLITPEKPCP